MPERPHQIITRPDAGAAPFSYEGRTRRRFDRRLRLLGIPDDLTGWSVLDIGAWHGFFSFECERRGADRVLAVDSYAWDRFGMDEFLAARERLGSSVEHRRADVHDLDPDDLRALTSEASMICGIPLVGTNRIVGGGPGWDERGH